MRVTSKDQFGRLLAIMILGMVIFAAGWMVAFLWVSAGP
jgi:hypothetical protein